MGLRQESISDFGDYCFDTLEEHINENVIEMPGRFDYIMLKSPYPKENSILNSVQIIGNKRELQVTPSDHYGVICDLEFI